jgi:hypothetical protein
MSNSQQTDSTYDDTTTQKQLCNSKNESGTRLQVTSHTLPLALELKRQQRELSSVNVDPAVFEKSVVFPALHSALTTNSLLSDAYTRHAQFLSSTTKGASIYPSKDIFPLSYLTYALIHSKKTPDYDVISHNTQVAQLCELVGNIDHLFMKKTVSWPFVVSGGAVSLGLSGIANHLSENVSDFYSDPQSLLGTAKLVGLQASALGLGFGGSYIVAKNRRLFGPRPVNQSAYLDLLLHRFAQDQAPCRLPVELGFSTYMSIPHSNDIKASPYVLHPNHTFSSASDLRLYLETR